MTESHPSASITLPQGQLTLIRQGNLLYLASDQEGADGIGKGPVPEDVARLLHPHLSYDYRQFNMGWAARDPVTGRKRRVTVTERRIYDFDTRGRLRTNFGFLHRIHRVLKGAGYSLRYVDLAQQLEAQHKRPQRYQADFGNVSYHFKFRERQEQCIEAISRSPHGVIHAVTGFGKMALIVMTCLLYPRAKIHVVTYRVPLVNKLTEYLTRYLPNIGQFGDGSKRFGDRVTVFSSKSLHHSDFDADILLCDEAHELVTDDTSKYLARYQSTRNFAFTATPTGRADGSDIRLEAFFGPRIFHLPYWEAVELGLVVPIRVLWNDVILDRNPAAGYEDVERKRRGIWFNDARNDIIANAILSQPEDEQRLVLTDTVYHAVELYKRVRHKLDVTLVYDTIDLERFTGYKASDHLPEDLPRMTPELKERHRKRFEAGEGHYISTPTWEVGVDPTFLQHLFIASSFRSEIKAQQAPGRASRINPKAGKAVGYVHDFVDQFDNNFYDAGRARRRVYESLRWEQLSNRPETNAS